MHVQCETGFATEAAPLSGSDGGSSVINRNHGQLPSRIPEFSSIEEEAEFWNTHDFTDYLDASWPVTVPVAPDFRSVYAVYLDREVYEALSRRARE